MNSDKVSSEGGLGRDAIDIPKDAVMDEEGKRIYCGQGL